MFLLRATIIFSCKNTHTQLVWKQGPYEFRVNREGESGTRGNSEFRNELKVNQTYWRNLCSTISGSPFYSLFMLRWFECVFVWLSNEWRHKWNCVITTSEDSLPAGRLLVGPAVVCCLHYMYYVVFSVCSESDKKYTHASEYCILHKTGIRAHFLWERWWCHKYTVLLCQRIIYSHVNCVVVSI